MQKTSLWQRLMDAFNPPPPKAIPIPQPVLWQGTEQEFFNYLDTREFISVPDDAEKPRTILYVDGKTHENFAMAVRWPNRYYYYLIET
ncbi:hypothetical protein pEaSNUABM11_00115 [Erwinia phage pEa_SNUABM_11]|nr:hypothetical protein pEaSNUABM11_00115 [Erwinia phage pEa_SNUABM_11]